MPRKPQRPLDGRGGYDYVAESLFRRCTGFDRFLLEYDDERSGSFEPLASLPRDRTVVLGLVSTKNARIEPRDEIIARLRAAAEFAPPEQLALSTQCGFSSTVDSHPDMTEQVQAAKLARVAETVAEFWPS